MPGGRYRRENGGGSLGNLLGWSNVVLGGKGSIWDQVRRRKLAVPLVSVDGSLSFFEETSRAWRQAALFMQCMDGRENFSDCHQVSPTRLRALFTQRSGFLRAIFHELFDGAQPLEALHDNSSDVR